MRIAQVSPLYESVPPLAYGGTERVVYYLTEELVSQGHEVTLFASGDSKTRANLVAPCSRSLRLDDQCKDVIAPHVVMVEKVFANASNFDLIHFHIDDLHFPLARIYRVPHITTLHGRLDLPELANLYREYPEMPVVSISDAQRKPLPWLNWQGTVHHGLAADAYSFREGHGDYLAFLGRISPEKGLDRAIEIARRVGMPLRVAAKVDSRDRGYFAEVIQPLLSDGKVEFIGEIGEQDKNDFLGNAYALIFPIDWPEPFGMVMIEAMACGTPVVACSNGSVPEIIEHGVTGFICSGIQDAVDAVRRVRRLSRTTCRRRFEDRFTASRMAADYVALYEKAIGNCDKTTEAGRWLEHGRDHVRQLPHPGDLVPTA